MTVLERLRGLTTLMVSMIAVGLGLLVGAVMRRQSEKGLSFFTKKDSQL